MKVSGMLLLLAMFPLPGFITNVMQKAFSLAAPRNITNSIFSLSVPEFQELQGLIGSTMSIWVKRVDVDDDAFEIDLEIGASIDCLRSAICSALRERFRIETSTVVMCAANRREPLMNAKDTSYVVERNMIGCSDMSPYLFRIPQNVPTGSFHIFRYVMTCLHQKILTYFCCISFQQLYLSVR